MKTHKSNLLNKTVLVVEMPRVYDYGFGQDLLWIYDKETDEMHDFEGTYILLGKSDEIKEVDVRELVVRLDTAPSFSHNKTYYHDYKNDDYGFKTAKESFFSAIEMVIYWDVNPFNYAESFSGNMGDVIEAQSLTFDRNRTFIFIES